MHYMDVRTIPVINSTPWIERIYVHQHLYVADINRNDFLHQGKHTEFKNQI